MKIEIETIDLEKITFEIEMVNGKKFKRTIVGTASVEGHWCHNNIEELKINKASEYLRSLCNGWDNYETDCGKTINTQNVLSVKVKKTEKRLLDVVRVINRGWFRDEVRYKIKNRD